MEGDAEVKKSLLNAIKTTAEDQAKTNSKFLDTVSALNDRMTILDNKITVLEEAAKKQTARKKKASKKKARKARRRRK